MKKLTLLKLLSLVLTLCAFLALFTACGRSSKDEIKCMHQYADELTCHDRKCTLCGKTKKASSTEHVFSDEYTCHDRECLCGYIEEATTEHEYEDGICVCGDLDRNYVDPELIFTLDPYATGYEITGYSGSKTKLYIPSKFSDLPVTSIGFEAFSNCDFMTEILISDGIMTIYDNAFYDMDALKSVTFVENSRLRSIGNSAFDECQALSNFIIPDSVESIGDYAFYYCSSLKSIIIPDSVNSVGEYVFSNCFSLTYNVKDGLRYLGNDNNKYIYLTGVEDKSITSAIIDGNCKFIGNNAFRDCYSLTIYCEGESELDGWASDWNSSNCPIVWDCNNNDVANDGYIYAIVDGIRYALKDNAASVARQASNITEAVIKSNISYKGTNYNVTNIGDYAFYNCDSLESVEIGGGVTSIGYAAFYSCDSLDSIVIPDSVTSIDTEAFHSCDSLENVTFGNNSQLESIGDYAFYDCTSLESIVIPDNVISIGNRAFDNCTSLESMTFGNNSQLESIGNYAFYYCTSLESIIIPDSVTSIGNKAFSNCCYLASVTFGENGKLESIGEGAFYDCDSLTSIIIPDSVTEMGADVFYYCPSLTVYCEAESQPTNWDIYWNDSNCPIVWDCNNNDVADDGYIYTVVDGIRYALKDNEAIVARQSSNITEAVIKSNISYKGTNYNVTTIGNSAFNSCDYLESIVIPDSVTNIGDYAFRYCTSLESIVIPDSVTNIGYAAFYSCDFLESIVIPDNVLSIGNEAFLGCVSLESVTFGNNSHLESIGNYAFYNCDSLTSIVIPDSVTSIGERAFYNCDSLESIIISDNVTSISYETFYACYSLTSVIIPDSVTSIGESAFEYCTSLTNVTFGEDSKLESIGFSAFLSCTSLTSIIIPGSVVRIIQYAFLSCNSLTIYCEVESKPSGWDNNYWNYSNCPVVWDCNNNDVADDGYIYTIVEGIRYALKDNEAIVARQSSNITEAVIKSNISYKGASYSVTSIRDYAFDSCYSLESIEIPDSVTSIGDSAFKYCSSLESIVIPDSVESIGEYAFYNCNSLTIYCEAESLPTNWASNWKDSNCTVEWGYVGE